MEREVKKQDMHDHFRYTIYLYSEECVPQNKNLIQINFMNEILSNLNTGLLNCGGNLFETFYIYFENNKWIARLEGKSLK